MPSFLIEPLAFIFILGAAVILHEFGHFIVAKLFKIRVETFSVGFGPRLFGVKWGETDYRVSAIPLGGYVKLGGDESNAPLEGAGAVDIPPEQMFNLRPKWQRILVALAGPVMNVITALSIPFAAALMYGVQATPAPVVNYVVKGGAAEIAGLKPGDRIVKFNGAENPKWDTINGDALLSPDQPLPMIVDRNGQRMDMTIKPTPRTENGETAGTLDFVPDYGGYPVVIHEVTPNSPAAASGLQPNDRVAAVAGEKVRSAAQVTAYIKEHRDQPLQFTVERSGQLKEISTDSKRLADGVIGVKISDEFPLHKVGLGGAAGYAYRSNVEIIKLTGKALGQVFTGKRSVRNTLSGPIGIYKAAAIQVNRLGWDGVFQMLGFLSLNLGVFNLLPIPVLDGGAIFLLLLEGLLAFVGLTLSTTVRERIQQVGFVMVILLMVFVISNDLLKSFTPDQGTKPAASAPAK
ncbi:MAG TPA: RIP metalloprotease RseP [Pyrinomonadaceae bacterium]|nr:RIP metalloprotease RseP [Pyrinomonadaceae bacterium]